MLGPFQLFETIGEREELDALLSSHTLRLIQRALIKLLSGGSTTPIIAVLYLERAKEVIWTCPEMPALNNLHCRALSGI